MVPAGQSRAAPYDAAISEIAHACDSCEKHNDTYLWVPETEAVPTPQLIAVYDDYEPFEEYGYPIGTLDQFNRPRKSQPEMVDITMKENFVFLLVSANSRIAFFKSSIFGYSFCHGLTVS